MSLRDKDQQIKLLIKERDEHKFQAELMAQRASDWKEKYHQSEEERSHVTIEADDEVVELRRLAQEFEDENRRLAKSINSKEQTISDIQFKLDELECERADLKQELEDKCELVVSLQRDQQQLEEGSKNVAQISHERAISKAKYEREIEDLKETIKSREEQMMQLRSSLEMRKNEAANSQSLAQDLERKLKIEIDRNERNMKRIDEINLELKDAKVKLETKQEENAMYEKQVKQLRQDLRTTEEKLEQLSLARKKDVDVLHNKLSQARQQQGRQSQCATPTSPQPSQHQQQSSSSSASQLGCYKTPTPQDEIVRLQMDIRDLKDQLIDREAELDCNRRDMELMRHKMETRTLEVDANNQELARRCQDLLEQNRQSEETVKQLLKSTSEHSASLMRATEELKEANGKCVFMRDHISELEAKLDEQVASARQLERDNNELQAYNEQYCDQIESLRKQVDSLNGQLSDLCEQLDVQTDCLHKDREALADQLSQNEINFAQTRHELATAKQDLRSNRLQTQEVTNERDRLKADLVIKDKLIASRNNIIETLRHELEDNKKSLGECKQKIEELCATLATETAKLKKDFTSQFETLSQQHAIKCDSETKLKAKCDQLAQELELTEKRNEEEQLRQFDEMRQKHSADINSLKQKIKELEELLEEAKSTILELQEQQKQSAAATAAELISCRDEIEKRELASELGSQATLNEFNCYSAKERDTTNNSSSNNNNVEADDISKPVGKKDEPQQDYEGQIEFLNSLVVDMQRECDTYKSKLAQVETMNIMNEFDQIILSNQPTGKTTCNGGGLASSLRGARISQTLQRNPVRPQQHLSNASSELSSASSGSTKAKGATVVAPGYGSATLTRSNPADACSGTGSFQQQLDSRASKAHVRISGRPFCDICNIFDSHHTVYCPKVGEKLATRNTVSNNNNNNNNETTCPNNIISSSTTDNTDHVDEFFRDYEQSIKSATIQEYSSLRRSHTLKPSRPYCDHCDLFGHNLKSCSYLGTA